MHPGRRCACTHMGAYTDMPVGCLWRRTQAWLITCAAAPGERLRDRDFQELCPHRAGVGVSSPGVQHTAPPNVLPECVCGLIYKCVYGLMSGGLGWALCPRGSASLQGTREECVSGAQLNEGAPGQCESGAAPPCGPQDSTVRTCPSHTARAPGLCRPLSCPGEGPTGERGATLLGDSGQTYLLLWAAVVSFFASLDHPRAEFENRTGSYGPPGTKPTTSRAGTRQEGGGWQPG